MKIQRIATFVGEDGSEGYRKDVSYRLAISIDDITGMIKVECAGHNPVLYPNVLYFLRNWNDVNITGLKK